MREIKFRAWDKINKRIGEVKSFTQPEQTPYMLVRFAANSLAEAISRNDIEIMQYTGLKDKNGKEIYEGDIVKRVVAKNCYQDESPCEVKYEAPQFYPHGWGLNGFIYEECNWEIIGNIYVNPGLLTSHKVV